MGFVSDVYAIIKGAGNIYSSFLVVVYILLGKLNISVWHVRTVTLILLVYSILAGIIRHMQFYILENSMDTLKKIEESNLSPVVVGHQYSEMLKGVRSGFKFQTSLICLYIIYLCVIYVLYLHR